jgi:hypothetical protein
MTEPEWRVRVASESDRVRLAGFTCADRTARWSVEVEKVIRTQLLDWALAPGAVEDDPILLVSARGSNELVGVAAHERLFLSINGAEMFAATKLYVIAVSRAWQGRRFTGGQRASDVVMSAAMSDIAERAPPRDARVYAIVHAQNVKSLALCRRHGLVHELSKARHDEYVRLVTEHRER